MVSELQIFDDITTLFSHTDVPLVHEVVPMLILLEERLENICDALDLPKVICIAAIASLLVVEKYLKLSDLSEVYHIAMGLYNTFKKYLLSSCAAVMCPDRKLTWFNDEGTMSECIFMVLFQLLFPIISCSFHSFPLLLCSYKIYTKIKTKTISSTAKEI